MEFLDKNLNSISCKKVFLKAMINECDEKGLAKVDYLIDFYNDRKARGFEEEKKQSVY
ncbi:MAG: hypothetical protein E6X72_05690 [Clostridioides difficile]|nr:hypothetical protein [Clostridium butyricum]MDU4853871.1 hypothetical protein [Clostridioides difficile]